MKKFYSPLAFLIVAIASNANATTVTYSTNAAGTGFSSGATLTQQNSFGNASTLTFIPDVSITTGTPSGINLGNFTLVCPSCSTQAIGSGAYFNPFTFDLVITDLTDNASGIFVGSSTGGAIYSDVSQLSITWDPLLLGPNTNNALTGSFGPTTFSTTVFTGIVAPNSGAVHGQTTVQGYVTSDSVPEPPTLPVLGSILLSVGLWRGKRTLSRRQIDSVAPNAWERGS